MQLSLSPSLPGAALLPWEKASKRVTTTERGALPYFRFVPTRRRGSPRSATCSNVRAKSGLVTGVAFVILSREDERSLKS